MLSEESGGGAVSRKGNGQQCLCATDSISNVCERPLDLVMTQWWWVHPERAVQCMASKRR